MLSVVSADSICVKCQFSCLDCRCWLLRGLVKTLKDMSCSFGFTVSDVCWKTVLCTFKLTHLTSNLGIFSGGYHYALKVYIYERVRARNFARAWSYVQAAQAFPILIGVPFAGYLNEFMTHKAGYMFGFFCTTAASLILFLVGIHKRKITQHKHTRWERTFYLQSKSLYKRTFPLKIEWHDTFVCIGRLSTESKTFIH